MKIDDTKQGECGEAGSAEDAGGREANRGASNSSVVLVCFIIFSILLVGAYIKIMTGLESGSTSAVSTDTQSDDSAYGSTVENRSTERDFEGRGKEIADGIYVNGIIVADEGSHLRAMSLYGGGEDETFVSAVNDYAKAVPGSRTYCLVAPTSSEYYTPEKFGDYNASQESDIKDINKKLSGAQGINVCPVLREHMSEDIFLRTDHHWSALGAYYAARSFADAADVPFPDLTEYETKTKSGYLGTLYAFSGNNADLLNDPEDFVYYVPKKNDYRVAYYDHAFNFAFEGSLFADISEGDYYSTFIYNMAYSVKIKTTVKNGRRCLLVRDSYGSAFVPFLTGSFEEIYVIDMRCFEKNIVEFAKEKDITDTIFMCCSYSAVGPNAELLRAKV